MANIEVYLDGQLLPTPDVPFIETTTPNESDNYTLNGTLYTDFTNYRRSWRLQWARLSASQYDMIREIYNNQYVTEAYPILRIDHYDVYFPAKINISDKDIRFDGDCIADFSITLLEQFGVS